MCRRKCGRTNVPMRMSSFVPLPPRRASRVRGDPGQDARGVLPFRVSLLHGALRLPCDTCRVFVMLCCLVMMFCCLL